MIQSQLEASGPIIQCKWKHQYFYVYILQHGYVRITKCKTKNHYDTWVYTLQ